MDWKEALLYLSFCLLALVLLLCGVLLYVFWLREKARTAGPANAAPPPQKAEAGAALLPETEETPPLPAPSGHIRLWSGTPDRVSESSRPLWLRLCRLMDEEEVWRNPDLTLNHLAALSGSNRTRIGALVKEAGYDGYKDFVNRRRIDALLDLMDAGQVTAIRDAFLSVGYQSKMTALRHFREYVGMTPSEYLRQSLS